MLDKQALRKNENQKVKSKYTYERNKDTSKKQVDGLYKRDFAVNTVK